MRSALHHRPVGRVLEAHALIANSLRRLDEGAADIVIADDAELVRNLRFLRETDRRRHAGVRHGHDDVGLRGCLAREFGAHRLAHVVDVTPADDRIRPREIDVFEDAGTRRHRRERLVRLRAIFIEDDHFAVFHVAHVLRADDVERAGLGSQDRAAVELADHQRPDTERIASADQLLVGQADEGIGALELAQPLDETVDKTVASGARHEMQDHLGVGGRLHHGAFVHQVAAQFDAIGEIAIVADREAAAIELGEKRLHVAQDRLAGGRIAHMTDGGCAGQAIDHFAACKGVADKTEASLGMETLAVK